MMHRPEGVGSAGDSHEHETTAPSADHLIGHWRAIGALWNNPESAGIEGEHLKWLEEGMAEQLEQMAENRSLTAEETEALRDAFGSAEARKAADPTTAERINVVISRL